MRVPRMVRWVVRLIAWTPAAVGVLAVVVAWRCRTDVRSLCVRASTHVGYAQLTPGHLDLAVWNRFDYDAFQHKPPLFTVRHASVLTTTEPVGDEPATLAEKVADATRAWHAAGFGYVHGNGFPPATPSLREVWIPTWFVVGAAFTPLAILTLARRRRPTPAGPARAR